MVAVRGYVAVVVCAAAGTAVLCAGAAVVAAAALPGVVAVGVYVFDISCAGFTGRTLGRTVSCGRLVGRPAFVALE